MTAFKLKKNESARDGIRRVAHERIEHASRLLRDEGADPAEAGHEERIFAERPKRFAKRIGSYWEAPAL